MSLVVFFGTSSEVMNMIKVVIETLTCHIIYSRLRVLEMM